MINICICDELQLMDNVSLACVSSEFLSYECSVVNWFGGLNLGLVLYHSRLKLLPWGLTFIDTRANPPWVAAGLPVTSDGKGGKPMKKGHL